MKVVYLGRASRRVNAPPKVEGDVLELLSNNWDDFGFKTSFMTVCRIDKKEVDLGLIRLLVDEVHIASDYLDMLLQQGWEGEFPIPRTKYISVPSERSEEHTSELQSLMRISYAVFCLTKKKKEIQMSTHT